MRYIVKDYCKKYPNDRGDQNINDEDVVQPPNHKWIDQGDEDYKLLKTRLSSVGLPT